MFIHKDEQGLKMCQSTEVDAMLKALAKRKFKSVIEIGTAKGGFTLLLRKYFSCPILTFDIQDVGTEEEIQLKYKLFKEKDIIHDLDTYENIIPTKEKCLVLCDGGDKMAEFKYFAPQLKKGSVIGAHDAGKNNEWFKENFSRKGLWSESFEFSTDDIQDFLKEHKLKPILEKTAQNAIWFLAEKL